jgi:prevent-host-death family protein
MRTITATEASRRFSDLLDVIERGESVVVTRGNRPIAEIRPARRRTGKDLRAALSDTAPPNEHFEKDITDTVTLLTTDGTDPWADA